MGTVITGLKVSNYQGIQSLELDIPPAGGVFEGRNGSGKSSAIGAIEAALIAAGIKPENVRKGMNRAEIVVDLADDTVVRRIIRAGGGSDIAVIPDRGAGGGAARLKELLSAGSLDPLGVFLAKPDKREEMILKAIPITVTWTDIEWWLGPESETVKSWPGFTLDRPGPAVLKDIQDRFYATRTAQKKLAAAARAEMETASKRVGDALAKEDPALTMEYDARAVPQAEAALEGKRQTAADARARLANAQMAVAGRPAFDADLQRRREEIAAELAKVDEAASEGALFALDQATAEIGEEITGLEARLQEAKRRLEGAKESAGAMRSRLRTNDGARKVAAAMQELLATLEMAAAQAPTTTTAAEADASKAQREQEAAEWYLQQVKLREERRKLEAAEDAARAKAQEEAAKVDGLEAIMKTLTTAAPADLGQRGGIPGFDFAAMTLDGVSIGTLNTAALMAFSVRLAKRIQGTQVKVLVADGMERLDGPSFDAFVKLACDDGWQLIGSRVTDGETLTFHAIDVEA